MTMTLHSGPITDPQAEEAAERGAERLAATLATLTLYSKASADAKAHTELLHVRATPDAGNIKNPNDRIQLVARTPDGDLTLRITDHAHGQMSEKVLGPGGRKYWDRMCDAAPDLAATNANYWLHREPERRLLRMVAPVTEPEQQAVGAIGATMTLRAFLSDTYRTVDNFDLAQTALPVIAGSGAWLEEAHVSETRMRLRFVTGGEDVFALARQRGVDVSTVLSQQGMAAREIVRMGFSLTNSEVGAGSIAIEPWAEVVRCLNGMVCSEPLRQRHVGKRGNDDQAWSQSTMVLDDAAFLLKVRDRMQEALSETNKIRAAQLIAKASGTPIAVPVEVPTFEFVRNVGRKLELTDREVAMFSDEVTQELHTSTAHGGLTRWALVQGLTATARNTKAAGDMDRGCELERQGFQVLTTLADKLQMWGRS